MRAGLLSDKQFWAAVVAAPIFYGLLFAWARPAADLSWPLSAPLVFLEFALLYPVLEELVFRGLLQEWLMRRWPKKWGLLSLANLVTSLVFAGLHFFYHAPAWSLMIFLPSLVFGYFRERHATVLTPIILHVFYNFGYYLIFFQPGT